MAIWDVSVQCLLELAKLQINIGNAKKKAVCQCLAITLFRKCCNSVTSINRGVYVYVINIHRDKQRYENAR